MKFSPFLALVSLLLVAQACTSVSDYYPGSTAINVDGTEYMVQQMSSSTGNSWVATLNKPTGQSLLLIDPAIYAGNIKAIERASGCPVVAGSVQNTYNSTRASVDCSSAIRSERK